MGVDIRDLNFSVNIGKFPFALMGWFLSYLHKCDLVHPLTIFCSLVKRFRSLGFSAQGSLFEPRPGHTFVEHYFPPLSIKLNKYIWKLFSIFFKVFRKAVGKWSSRVEGLDEMDKALWTSPSFFLRKVNYVEYIVIEDWDLWDKTC